MTDAPSRPYPVSATLLPCPFCGATNIKIKSNGIGDYFAICQSDDEEVPSCGARTSDYRCETIDQAVRRWNVRPSVHAQTKHASPQEVQEACAKVADRTALRCVREQIPGDETARFIARAIRALIPPALPSTQCASPPKPYDVAFHENQLDKLEALKAIERGEYTDLPPLGDSKRVPTQTSGEALADKVIADPTILHLRECGFQPAARFEATLKAAIMRACALTSTPRGDAT